MREAFVPWPRSPPWPPFIACALAVLAAGCSGPGTSPPHGLPEDAEASPGWLATYACSYDCYEPTVAIGAGWIASTAGEGIAVSEDGGATFALRPDPPRPVLACQADGCSGDETVHASPQGRLYYTALLREPQAIQVAASDDGGRTWPVNTIIGAQSGIGFAGQMDRQWLAFAGHDTVYLLYQLPAPGSLRSLEVGAAVASQIFVARSDDGGQTFGLFRPVLAPDDVGLVVLGAPIMLPGDRLAFAHMHWPWTDDVPSLRFVTSDDGESFASATVGQFWLQGFPMAARTADGSLHVAYNDWAGGIRIASSDDGATWTPGMRWSALLEQAHVSPWLASTPEGDLVLLYYATFEGRARLVAAHETSGAVRHTIVVDGLPMAAGRAVATDFPHLAWDGYPVVAWPLASQVVVAAVALDPAHIGG